MTRDAAERSAARAHHVQQFAISGTTHAFFEIYRTAFAATVSRRGRSGGIRTDMFGRRVCCVLCLLLNLVTGVEPVPHPSLPEGPFPKAKKGNWPNLHKRHVSVLKKRGQV